MELCFNVDMTHGFTLKYVSHHPPYTMLSIVGVKQFPIEIHRYKLQFSDHVLHKNTTLIREHDFYSEHDTIPEQKTGTLLSFKRSTSLAISSPSDGSQIQRTRLNTKKSETQYCFASPQIYVVSIFTPVSGTRSIESPPTIAHEIIFRPISIRQDEEV